jgi:hypothetical protein
LSTIQKIQQLLARFVELDIRQAQQAHEAK